MTNLALRFSPLALLALAAPAAGTDDARPVVYAQVLIRERVVIRVPRVGGTLPVGRVPVPTPVTWREGKGPSCIAADRLAAAAIHAVNRVDLVLAGGARMRAELDGDCAPLDFYSGFYLRAAKDGQVCARRDSISVRSGASCLIARFRTLTAKR